MPPLPKPPHQAVASLADGLVRALKETGWSARGLAAAAGLGPDAVRNVTRGISTTLRGDRLDRIAAILGIHPEALTGERPWPRRRLRKAPMAEPAPRRRTAGSVTIPEADLRLGAYGEVSNIREWPEAETWTVPREMLEERGLSVEDLMIVRAPTTLRAFGIMRGDRLMVDVGDTAGQAAAGLAVVRGVRGWRIVEGVRKRAAIGGRVVGRWSWTAG